MAKEKVQFRRPLEEWEVPLPPGGDFHHGLLDPEYKRKLKAEHEAKIRQIMEDRLLMYERAETDLEYRQLLYEQCRRDPRFFIDYFVWTYDDRIGRIEPMVLYPFQSEKLVDPYKDMIATMAPERYSGMVAKSRALGWSWVGMALRDWAFLFQEHWSILVGGQQRDDVDDGGMAATQQSLFGKLRFILEHLPQWMKDDLLGRQFFRDSASNSYNKRMMMRNPMKPQNMIQGAQFGPTFGRGARFSEVFGDEVAWAEGMEAADTSLKQTTNRFFGGSTPQGLVGFFPDMMFGPLRVARFWCWWAEHPDLDLDWYNEQRQTMTDQQIAQELDISFEKSLGNTVVQGIDIGNFFKPGDIAEYDPHLPLQVWIDPGWSDNMAAIWLQWDKHKEEGRIVDIVVTRKKRIDWIVPFVTGHVPGSSDDEPWTGIDSRGDPWPHHYNDVEKDIILRHRGWRVPEQLGDFAGGAKSANTGTSCWDELEGYGMFVEGVKMPQNEIALEHMNLVLRHFSAPERLREQRNGPQDECPTLLEVLTMWRYPARKAGSIRASTKPVHNRFCHPGDCIKMACWDIMVPQPKQMDARLGEMKRHDPREQTSPGYKNPFRS